METNLHPCLKSFGSEENAARVQDLLGKMGLRLVDHMRKDLKPAREVFSRRKNWNRELESLKTEINYDGRGVKKGFLRSWIAFFIEDFGSSECDLSSLINRIFFLIKYECVLLIKHDFAFHFSTCMKKHTC